MVALPRRPGPIPAFVDVVTNVRSLMNDAQVKELLYQSLEVEIGGQAVYETAIRCAQNDELRKEWEKYLEETRTHEAILRSTFDRIGLDPDVETPGRAVVRFKGQSLVKSMEMALTEGGPAAAQLVAAECVVEAETKDHQDWELIGRVAEKASGDMAKALKEAHEQVEDQEDEHLYHTMGWARELWIESLGMPAVIPPPEEEKEVKTAIGAARAEQAREEML
jgi:ferritin-like metal-binding protein YciE